MASTETAGDATATRPAHCANCDIELRAQAVRSGGQDYCCEGCALGGPCVC